MRLERGESSPSPASRNRRHYPSLIKIMTAIILIAIALTGLVLARSDRIRVVVNGRALAESHFAVIVDGVLMIPAEPVAEALGAEFSYDEENSVVRISLQLNNIDNSPEATVDGTLVFVNRSGVKYHRAGCRYLSADAEAIELSIARQRGYEACKVCDPPH